MTTYNESYNGTFPFSDTTVQIALAANTALTYTIPGDNTIRYRCEFSYADSTNVWVGYNATATVPVAGAVTTVTNTSIELNPGRYGQARYVRGGDVLSFISGAVVSNMGFSLLQLPN